MHTLIRMLRARDLLLLFIGTVIGSGIFLTPGIILQQVGGSVGMSLLAWVLAGILSLLGALTFAELAASIPEAGGLYLYIRDGFGGLPAFLYGWCVFLVIGSGGIAALTRAFCRYLVEVVPLSPHGSTICGVLMIAALTAANVWGARKGSDLQNWTTLIKVALIVGLSIALLIWGHHFGELRLVSGATQHGTALISNFGLAMISALWAYEGWEFCTSSAGETIEPQKNIPIAFLMGSLILIAVFLVAVVADLVALGPAAALSSIAIAADAAKEVFGPWASRIVSITILIATFSAVNGTLMTVPRIFYAMARDRIFFRKFADIHPRFRTPAFAIVALGVWSAVLSCVGSFVQLIGGVIFISWIFNGLAAASIFPLRRRTSIEDLPYRVPGYPWTPCIFILSAAALVTNTVYRDLNDPKGFIHITIALLSFAIGIPIYFIWRKKSA